MQHMPESSVQLCARVGARPEASGKGLPELELWQGQEPGYQNQNPGNKGNGGNGGMEGGGGDPGQPGSFRGCWKQSSRL